MSRPSPSRLLFCADLHIGRSLHGRSLLDDQRHILDQITSLCREHGAGLLVVGGDLFDRAVPSAEAVALADRFFQSLVSGLGVQVVVVAGNHDSPERLDFAAGLLARQGLHIIGSFPDSPRPVDFGKDFEPPFELWALPYAEPPTIHAALDTQGLERPDGLSPGDHQAAWSRLMDSLRAGWTASPARPRLLAAHLLAMGGGASDSARPLSIGGSEAVDPSVFAGFGLVLLGHLHRCQNCAPGVWYPGSPLAYSASEADQTKHILLADCIDGRFEVQKLPLTPLRPVRRLRGPLAALLTGSSDDYICADIEEALPVPDAFARLQARYPWLLQAVRVAPAGMTDPEADDDRRRVAISQGERELIRAFLAEMGGDPVPQTWLAVVDSVLDEIRRDEREA